MTNPDICAGLALKRRCLSNYMLNVLTTALQKISSLHMLKFMVSLLQLAIFDAQKGQ
jgi:hypothetical protein